MAAGISTVLMWDYVFKIKVGNSVPGGHVNKFGSTDGKSLFV